MYQFKTILVVLLSSFMQSNTIRLGDFFRLGINMCACIFPLNVRSHQFWCYFHFKSFNRLCTRFRNIMFALCYNIILRLLFSLYQLDWIVYNLKHYWYIPRKKKQLPLLLLLYSASMRIERENKQKKVISTYNYFLPTWSRVAYFCVSFGKVVLTKQKS